MPLDPKIYVGSDTSAISAKLDTSKPHRCLLLNKGADVVVVVTSDKNYKFKKLETQISANKEYKAYKSGWEAYHGYAIKSSGKPDFKIFNEEGLSTQKVNTALGASNINIESIPIPEEYSRELKVGTEPTGTGPTGTEPTGTEPTGTEPTETETTEFLDKLVTAKKTYDQNYVLQKTKFKNAQKEITSAAKDPSLVAERVSIVGFLKNEFASFRSRFEAAGDQAAEALGDLVKNPQSDPARSKLLDAQAKIAEAYTDKDVTAALEIFGETDFFDPIKKGLLPIAELAEG